MGERYARSVVQALSALVRYALTAALCLPLAVGCYALWDSHTVVERAERDQWQPYKPAEPEPLSFWELQRVNPEVRAWLEVYGTNIDYPVCQSGADDWEKYLDHDALGAYSLSGALFMDVESAADFSDFDTIVYGHHMDQDVMFGPITDFAEEAFFVEHRFGDLFYNDANHGLEFFCYLLADAYDTGIYRRVGADAVERETYLALLRERARWWRQDVEVGANDRIVLLSTCTSDSTNGRAILVGKICGERIKNPYVRIPNLGTGVDAPEGVMGVPWWGWLALVVFVVIVAVLIWGRRRDT